MVILASPKTLGHSPKARLVVTINHPLFIFEARSGILLAQHVVEPVLERLGQPTQRLYCRQRRIGSA